MIELDIKRRPPMYRIKAVFLKDTPLGIRWSILVHQTIITLNYYLWCKWFGHSEEKVEHVESEDRTEGHTRYCAGCLVIIEATREIKDR